MSHLGIIGGGWAGLAAAVRGIEQGHTVTLWEAARVVGGRARSLPSRAHLGEELILDNGQHLLLSAYTQTRALMQSIGIEPREVLLDTHLDLRTADGQGLALPKQPSRWPSPWQLAWCLAKAQGWNWRDRLALARWSRRWRRQQPLAWASVQDICSDLTETVMQQLITPLCVSALNLPPDQAGARWFLPVLQDTLWAPASQWRAWLPRVPLGQVIPEPALAWLRQRGAQIRLGERVQRLQLTPDGVRVQANHSVDHLIIATPAQVAGQLAAQLPHTEAQQWADSAHALKHTAIATAYAHAEGLRLPRPMLALAARLPLDAQFVMDLGQLGRPCGHLAAVLSHAPSDAEGLKAHLTQQLRRELGDPHLRITQLVVEKRAAFAATPDAVRPIAKVCPKVWACGDYVAGPYPATLEGAVRSAHELPWENLRR